MANLSITTACNRQCRYCFARSAFTSRISDVLNMDAVTFRRALDFLERSGIDQARLLGGEPTLHPHFPDLVAQVMDRCLRLLVFSNGLMPEAALQCLEATPLERTAVLINILMFGESTSKEQERLVSVLRQLGPRVLLGLNIDTPAVQFDFTLDLIQAYQLAKTIRLGLAHPTLTGENHFLHPRDYSTIGRRVIEFARRAQAAGVNLEFDCGFTPCMFPPEGLEILGEPLAELGQRCNPILDILPDGQVVACYPLASMHYEMLPDEHDATWLRSQFEKTFESYHSIGIFKECSVCPLKKSGVCRGGCLATAMRRLRHAAFTVELPKSSITSNLSIRQESPDRNAISSPALGNARWIIPYVDQPLAFWERIAENDGRSIKAVYLPLPGEVPGSGRPPQPTEHLQEFLRCSPFSLSVLINPIVLPRPVDELAPQIIEALKKLIGEFNVGSVTVSDLLLAQHIRASLPELPLTASVLMDIAQPNQALMLQGVCDILVPASRIMRDLPALKALRAAFSGKIRVIVNEACLPNCPFRVQHFYEMGSNIGHPHSLCSKLLQEFPWLRLTGAWVLPQLLHLYDGVYDELKLAGRVTLRNPDTYRRVLDAYIHRTPLFPNEIGGGPASVLDPLDISEEFFAQTLHCGHQCHTCTVCQEYWRLTSGDFSYRLRRKYDGISDPMSISIMSHQSKRMADHEQQTKE
ncbi:radical SAM domain protein [Candidatus Vecturithrix granuli]|uniref:Radical SAM domain protein n=1 Tax=Vecturithrix granuli TaxID=1499967 RepID=A0A081C2V9_VECG1|nr:radical SAM domain protein [Candidatus Vecturithrix granuli]